VFHYQYLGGRLLAEINGGNGVYSREVIWLGNIPIAQVRNVSGTATLYWIHADPLGTPRIITDGTGGTVWQRTQEPFGENDVVSNPVGAYTNLRFDGQFTDTLTGLSYNLMRDYDPSIGRYTTADPIGIAGGLNRYGYGMNNPLVWTDPTEGLLSDM
jgi:RHS repeat-associated protein